MFHQEKSDKIFEIKKLKRHFTYLRRVFVISRIQSNSVKTNSSEREIFVRYNRVNMCTKITNFASKSVRYNRVFVITKFLITEFHCTPVNSRISISEPAKALVPYGNCTNFFV